MVEEDAKNSAQNNLQQNCKLKNSDTLQYLYTENLYRWSSRIRQIAFPRRVLPTDVLLNRIFFFQRTTEVNVPLFNPTENRVLTSHFFKKFLIFFFAHWMDSKAALYPQFSAFAMS